MILLMGKKIFYPEVDPVLLPNLKRQINREIEKQIDRS